MLEKEWLRAEEPVSIKKNFIDKFSWLKTNPVMFCPAFRNFNNNLYGLKFIYDYNIHITKTLIKSDDYDQTFFENHITIREPKGKFISFSHTYIFFSEKEIEMTAHIPPFLEENEASYKIYPVIGKFNIGKWFRPIECPLILKEKYDNIHLKRGDIYTYLHFDVEDKIVFKKFYPTDKIHKFVTDTTSTTVGLRLVTKSLNEFYNKFVIKKQILKEIKQNIVE